MQPKSGKAPSPVTPAAPVAPDEADVADPGQVSQTQTQQQQDQAGQRGQRQAPRFKPGASGANKSSPNSAGQSSTPSQSNDEHFIEIEVVDEQDSPVTGLRYEIELPNGQVADGTLDEKGVARVDKIPEPGDCKITFPDLDQDTWLMI